MPHTLHFNNTLSEVIRRKKQCYLESLLCYQHAVVSAALLWRDHGPDLLLCRQSEVRLQHPPVRVHPWQEDTVRHFLLPATSLKDH